MRYTRESGSGKEIAKEETGKKLEALKWMGRSGEGVERAWRGTGTREIGGRRERGRGERKSGDEGEGEHY